MTKLRILNVSDRLSTMEKIGQLVRRKLLRRRQYNNRCRYILWTGLGFPTFSACMRSLGGRRIVYFFGADRWRGSFETRGTLGASSLFLGLEKIFLDSGRIARVVRTLEYCV